MIKQEIDKQKRPRLQYTGKLCFDDGPDARKGLGCNQLQFNERNINNLKISDEVYNKMVKILEENK